MLIIENVYYRYKTGNVDVLKEINASFETGQLYSIMGPSGMGKTTLLSIIAGLDRPTHGAVYIDGEDLMSIDLNEYRRNKVAMIFQQFHLFPLLTSLENTSYLLESSGIKREEAEARAKELLEIVGIGEDKHKRYPANLSGGEQQRVAIARALSNGAKLILADEPTGNLDEENSEAVIGILKNLAHNEDYCVIVVTHNPDVAAASDVVFKLSYGGIKQVGDGTSVQTEEPSP